MSNPVNKHPVSEDVVMHENSPNEPVQVSKAPISRRKLLASLGLAGVAMATRGWLSGSRLSVAYGNASVTNAVYNNSGLSLEETIVSNHCIPISLQALRLETAPSVDDIYYVTDEGKRGFFHYDATDTSSLDNTGTVVVSTGGKRFKRLYDDMLLSSWFGTKGDGVTEDTVALQNALNASVGKKLYIPLHKNNYYLSGQLIFPSHITIEFEHGTVIQAIDTLLRTTPYERLVRMKNVTDIIIYGNGATFRMNKAAYSSGEQAHIFDISGSSNITIEQINANDSGGDGFYIGNYEATLPYCKNVVLRDCVANNNRRQGLSVISVDGLLVEHCTFSNTSGTSPQAGVDIEPNNTNNLEMLKNVRFIHCLSENNKGRGFVSMVKKLKASNEKIDILFQNCISRGNTYGFVVSYGNDAANSGAQGEIKFIDCRAEKDLYCGFAELSCSAESVKTTYIRCIAYNSNSNNDLNYEYALGSSFIITSLTTESRLSIGNAYYYECEAIDDRLLSQTLRGFTTKKKVNETIKNISYVNCKANGATLAAFEVEPISENVLIRNQPQLTIALPLSGAISLSYLGFKINNSGATAAVSYTLPKAKSGRSYTFSVNAPLEVNIIAASGDAILTPTGAGIVRSGNMGDSVTLLGRADDRWEVANAVGSWFPLV
ncbi:right-handed parallel beta-helix repeat-containing protein [Paenibacillus sp. RC67]|uniref:right-handed parallel beta-helix repeat-containing protein n=1 Tax=Paenibacillus sp. RC67 TaxID=3039392 RepID=UPI0024ADE1B5|nr:right-handed parallel beta-helix repeat-containing protein [Paenibacillus sp. RC67]